MARKGLNCNIEGKKSTNRYNNTDSDMASSSIHEAMGLKFNSDEGPRYNEPL